MHHWIVVIVIISPRYFQIYGNLCNYLVLKQTTCPASIPDLVSPGAIPLTCHGPSLRHDCHVFILRHVSTDHAATVLVGRSQVKAPQRRQLGLQDQDGEESDLFPGEEVKPAQGSQDSPRPGPGATRRTSPGAGGRWLQGARPGSLSPS